MKRNILLIDTVPTYDLSEGDNPEIYQKIIEGVPKRYQVIGMDGCGSWTRESKLYKGDAPLNTLEGIRERLDVIGKSWFGGKWHNRKVALVSSLDDDPIALATIANCIHVISGNYADILRLRLSEEKRGECTYLLDAHVHEYIDVSAAFHKPTTDSQIRNQRSPL